MRKGNIELKKIRANYFEVLHVIPNSYYQMEEDFPIVENGMRRKTEHSNYFVSESLFVNPESKYVVAHIDNGVVNFTGDRFMELGDDISNFVFCLRSGIKKSQK